jgi:excisionase family DNA binding protein
MEEQLMFDVPGDPSPTPEFLTIAEAAQRVRCCERTIRHAIDSGALRAGRINAVDGKRGRLPDPPVRPRDLDVRRWSVRDGSRPSTCASTRAPTGP